MLLNEAAGIGPLDLGRTVMTSGVLHALGGDPHAISQLLAPILDRLRNRDWGDVTANDRQANERDLAEGVRVIGRYRIDRQTILAIRTPTDEHPSGFITTVLLPEEY